MPPPPRGQRYRLPKLDLADVTGDQLGRFDGRWTFLEVDIVSKSVVRLTGVAMPAPLQDVYSARR